MAKILGVVTKCSGCMHRKYYSASRHECTLLDVIIPDVNTIPSFCTLTDHPVERKSRIEETLRRMQAEKQSFVFEILLLIAAKLKCEIGHFGDIQIPTLNGYVSLQHDAISSIAPSEALVDFFGSDRHAYRLYLGPQPSLLIRTNSPPDEARWMDVPLASK